MYREAASGIPGVLVWTATRTADSAGTSVLPDGCTDLIWHEDGLLVAGPDTRAQFSDLGARRDLTAVRFGPGVGPAVLGVDAADLRDARVPLDHIRPGAHVRRLVSDAESDPVGALLRETRRRLDGVDRSVETSIAAQLGAGASVAELAASTGWSARRLHRHALRAYGYGPKTLARVRRFRRAVGLARAGRPFADVAAECGFSDQAHLAREVRALSGTTLGALLG
ncbi:MAG: helix-turn-helix domain-containing protein [Rhodococcus ruber]|nr:helix-turn-helix domain-containing protein [Rhodococcus ruber]